MAVLSSHFLNGVDGTHAGDVGVEVVSVAPDGSRHTVFTGSSGADGRFLAEIEIEDGAQEYEMVVASGPYFAARNLPAPGMQIMRVIIVRFTMPDPAARYHIPIIMSPNSYSCWWSS
jgi:5-hydroxyisourate hydrolase